MLAGARSIAAIAEWAADAPQPIPAALGARRDAPDHFAVPAEATIRRTLIRLDADALAAAVGAWLADQDQPAAGGRRRRQDPARRPHQHRQRRWPPGAPAGRDGPHRPRGAGPTPGRRRAEEVTAFAPLLASLDLAGTVITADALQTHPQAAEFLVTEKRAHYLLVVKANKPTLLDRCQRLPWHRVPVLDRTRDRGHGRIESRTLKAVSVNQFGFPHAAQVLQVTRKTRNLDASPRGFTTVTVYAITSLPFQQASPPGSPTCCAGTGRSKRCTTSATPPSPRRPPRSAPAPLPASWPACAIWSSGCSVGRGRPTSPPRCAATPATHADPWPPSGSASDETRHHDTTTEPCR